MGPGNWYDVKTEKGIKYLTQKQVKRKIWQGFRGDEHVNSVFLDVSSCILIYFDRRLRSYHLNLLCSSETSVYIYQNYTELLTSRFKPKYFMYLLFIPCHLHLIIP